MSIPVIFFDNNSTTRVDDRVMEKMLPYFTKYYGNASSKTHSYGWEAEAAVERAREQVASFIGAEPAEIIFTSGSTEAINIALRGVAENYSSKGKHIITCKTEHKAVLDTCSFLEENGFTITHLGVDREGNIDIDELVQSFTPETILVCIMQANNETGVIHQVNAIGEKCRGKNVLFFCDATQAAGKIKVDVNEMRCDLLCLSAHKLYGPKGVGALYMRRKKPAVRLAAILTGGGHEKGLRPGTLNVPGIVGLGAACELAGESLWDDAASTSIQRTIFEQLLEQQVPLYINGSVRHRLPNTTNICFRGLQASRLIKLLPGIAFSTGSACTSALPQPSHVLKAMGFNDEHVYASARFSFGRFTTKEEVETAVAIVIEAVQKLL